MTTGKDYVLGTNDEEVARLGLQHRAWRPRALAAWQSAGIAPGQTVLDVGCGPGYAALDLAELVGPSGRVIAIDKSERFLRVLDAATREQGLHQIAAHQTDLETGEFPSVRADRAWCRWVLSFVKNPRDVLARTAASLGEGGTIVMHEYFDYSTWRMAPRCEAVEEFVRAVMASWRDAGGEPNIALQIPRWLEELGFTVSSVRPIVDVVQPGELTWMWLRAFLDVGRQRLIDLGYLTPSRSEAIWHAFTEAESASGVRMITPGVLEIIALR